MRRSLAAAAEFAAQADSLRSTSADHQVWYGTAAGAVVGRTRMPHSLLSSWRSTAIPRAACGVLRTFERRAGDRPGCTDLVEPPRRRRGRCIRRDEGTSVLLAPLSH